MNIEYEKIFINLLKKRTRLEYELSNIRKRKNAIGRFCHTTREYIEASWIICEGNKISIGGLKVKN